MESARAQELLDAERLRVERLLAEMDGERGDDLVAANAPGDMFDSAEPLTREGTDESIRAELQERLAAIDRAEQRLEDGSYGLLGPQRRSRSPTTASPPIPPRS